MDALPALHLGRAQTEGLSEKAQGTQQDTSTVPIYMLSRFPCCTQVFQRRLEFQGAASGKLSCCRAEAESFVPAARQIFNYAITVIES